MHWEHNLLRTIREHVLLPYTLRSTHTYAWLCLYYHADSVVAGVDFFVAVMHYKSAVVLCIIDVPN